MLFWYFIISFKLCALFFVCFISESFVYGICQRKRKQEIKWRNIRTTDKANSQGIKLVYRWLYIFVYKISKKCPGYKWTWETIQYHTETQNIFLIWKCCWNKCLFQFELIPKYFKHFIFYSKTININITFMDAKFCVNMS